MDLLDLPPEIFGQVIHELVSKIGANRAWRVREVCRTFASAIAFNVLSQQPRKAFLKSKSNPKTQGTTLSNNAGIYLYYRTKVALDAKPELPAMVRGMVAYLKDGLAIQSFDSEERLLRQVCDNIGQSCKPDLILEGLRLGSQHSSMNKIGTSLSQEQKLTAATLVGSEPLMRPLLSELRPQDPGTEDLLRSPIVIAASLGYIRLLHMLLDQLRNNIVGQNLRMRALEEDVSRLFRLAIEQGCHETIQVIKEWTTKHSCLTSKWTFGYILYAATTTRSPISIVHVILDIPYKHPDRISRVTWSDFIAACAYERTDIVQLFLDEGHLDVKDTRPKICPLILAVRSGFRSIVEKVLAAGAKVHTSYDDGKNKRTAIELAMHKRSPGMVECLLEAGARIPGFTRWPQHEPTYEVLRKARMERHRVSVPEFKERFKMKGKQRTRR